MVLDAITDAHALVGTLGAGGEALLHRLIGSVAQAHGNAAIRCLAAECRIWDPATPQPGFHFLGRLDNRDELCRALCSPSDLNDAALAATAWSRWGEEALSRMVGAFAVAAWDGTREELVLAADAMGYETLFTASGPGYFAFAADPRVLLGCPGVGGVDAEHFAHWMFTGRALPDRSFFSGIRRIAPGQVLRVGRSGSAGRFYWRPGEAPPLRFRRDDDYVEAMREVLDLVVAPHLPPQGGGNVAADLSGGLDSTGVVSTAARLAPGCAIHAFTTVAEPGAIMPPARARRADGDWEGACDIAALYPNVTQHRIEAGGLHPMEMDPAETFARALFPVQFRETHAWHDSRRQAMRRLGHRVVLSGFGGNLAFSQTGQGLFADLAASGHWLAMLREGWATHRRTGRPLRSLLKGYALLPNLPPGLRQAGRRLCGKTEPAWAYWSMLRPDAVIRLGLAASNHAAGKLRPQENPGGAVRQLAHLIDRFRGKSVWRIRQTRGQGLDVRTPLMDQRMVEFVLSVPQDQFLRNGVGRWLTRRCLADRLPPAVVAETAIHRQCAEWAFRADRSRPYWMAALRRLEEVPLAGELLDLPRLNQLAATWPDPAQVKDVATLHREVLLPGISGGLFLDWASKIA